jgi:hypothetical protein
MGKAWETSNKSNTLPEIGGYLIEKYFHIFFVLKELSTWMTLQIPFYVKTCIVLG